MIRVLVVDDSHFMQTVIRNILERDEEIRVVGLASDGREAIEKVKELKPDVVTMDVMMPLMDGLETLREIMRECPTRVVMISAADKESADMVVKCLESGAVSFVSKPKGQISAGMDSISNEIVENVRLASTIDLEKLAGRRISPVPRFEKKTYDKASFAVAIGASLGGISSVEKVMMPLRKSGASFFLVQHMLPDFIEPFARRLDSLLGLKVKVGEDGDPVHGNVLYVAPGDMHMRVLDGRIVLDKGERINGVRPSADVLFSSVAKEYGKRSIGIILSGMGRDGARGIKSMHDSGALTIAESSESATIDGMPRSAIALGAIDMVVMAEEMHGVIEDRMYGMVSEDGQLL